MKKLIYVLLAINITALAFSQSLTRVSQWKTVTEASGGGSPGTTSLIAWYDMSTSGTSADLINQHNSGTHDLSASGTPTYASGYGVSDDSPAANWSVTGLSNSWMATDSDASFTIRFQGIGSITNGDYIFSSHGGAVYVRWITAGIRVEMGDVVHDTAIVPATSTWYTITVNFTASTDTVEVFVDGTSDGSTAGTYVDFSNTTYLGGNSTAQDTQIDFLACYNRVMTTDEVSWLYNTGSTRSYADL